MKITRIQAYRVELPLHEGSYKWSGGKSVSVFDSTVVAVETDAGVTGYGEVWVHRRSRATHARPYLRGPAKPCLVPRQRRNAA